MRNAFLCLALITLPIKVIPGCSRPSPPPAAAVPVANVSYTDACKLVDERLEKFQQAQYLQRESRKIDDGGETLKMANDAVEWRHKQLLEAYEIKAALEPKSR